MSDLSDLQPTIFFAMCTLKGVLWIPLYLLPELYLKGNNADAAEDAELYGIEPDDNQALELLQDHHVLLMERVCHYTNLFALLGLLSFYAVNPRLWQYQKYGWLLLALLLFQHLPQAALLHSGGSSWLGIESPEDDTTTADITTTTAAMIMASNRIFSTIGVVIFQVYALVIGHVTTMKRLAAEPFFVYFALVTMLLETHVTCISVWWCYGASAMLTTEDGSEEQDLVYNHFSTAASWVTRQLLVGILMGLLVGTELWYSKQHPEQLKMVRNQLRTINAKPKMKFV